MDTPDATPAPGASEAVLHPHEPEIAPVLDSEGRCMICVEAVLVHRLRTAHETVAALSTQAAADRAALASELARRERLEKVVEAAPDDLYPDEDLGLSDEAKGWVQEIWRMARIHQGNAIRAEQHVRAELARREAVAGRIKNALQRLRLAAPQRPVYIDLAIQHLEAALSALAASEEAER